MLVRGVIEDQVHHHAHPEVVSAAHQLRDVVHGAVGGEHGVVVPDVVAAVPERGIVEWQQPEAVHPQPPQVLETLDQAREVADAVVVAVREPAHQDLVEDRPFEPERVPVALDRLGAGVSPWDRVRGCHDAGRSGIGLGRRHLGVGRGDGLAHRRRRWSTWAGCWAGSSRT
jgi:hypothetical protein